MRRWLKQKFYLNWQKECKLSLGCKHLVNLKAVSVIESAAERKDIWSNSFMHLQWNCMAKVLSRHIYLQHVSESEDFITKWGMGHLNYIRLNWWDCFWAKTLLVCLPFFLICTPIWNPHVAISFLLFPSFPSITVSILFPTHPLKPIFIFLSIFSSWTDLNWTLGTFFPHQAGI